MGIEPTTSAWEADVLPLNYACIFNFGCLFSIVLFTVQVKAFLQNLTVAKMCGHPVREHRPMRHTVPKSDQRRTSGHCFT